MRFNKLTYAFSMLVALGLMAALFDSGSMLFAKTGSLMGSADNSSGIQVVVKETSVVETDDVFLGDISRIDAPDMLKEGLDRIEISSSPRPDEIKSLSRRKIVAAIKRQRFLPDNIVIQSPEQVYVKRAARTISESDVREFIISKISQQFRQKEVRLISLRVRGLKPYPAGKMTFLTDSDGLVDKNGRISTFVDVYINNRKEDRLSVYGNMEVYDNILCTNKFVKKGEILSSADVVLKKKNIFDLDDDVVRNFETVDRKMLRTFLKKGEYLRSSFFEPVPLVKKGDIIRLLSKNGNLSIVTTGISMEDGIADKLIRAENLSSGKTVRGIVRGKSIVEVVY